MLQCNYGSTKYQEYASTLLYDELEKREEDRRMKSESRALRRNMPLSDCARGGYRRGAPTTIINCRSKTAQTRRVVDLYVLHEATHPVARAIEVSLSITITRSCFDGMFSTSQLICHFNSKNNLAQLPAGGNVPEEFW